MKLLNKIRERGGILATILPLAGNRLAVLLYRLSHFLGRLRVPELPYIFQYINAVINGCEIHYRAKIGKGFKISHSRGIVIGAQVVIGDNVIIHSGVVMGKKSKKTNMPIIGNNVTIGANACLIGDIIIGDNCSIGANSMVNKSFDNYSLIGGVPAKLILIKSERIN